MKKIKNLKSNNNLRFFIFSFTIIMNLFSKEMKINANEINDSFYIDDSTNIDFDNFNELDKSISLTYTITNKGGFDFIEYFPNISELIVNIDTDDDLFLKDIYKIKKLSNLKKLCLKTTKNVSITKERFSFLSKCISLEELSIEGLSIEEGVLEDLDNLEKISIKISDLHYISNSINTDFSKLTFLKELNFLDSLPYDIAICFTSRDYDTLVSNNVNVRGERINEVSVINAKLDAIVDDLGIDSNDNDIDKFNKILTCILKLLEYDDKVAYDDKNGKSNSKELLRRFYIDGLLYGALNGDSAICGNYAALFTALSNRVGLKSYYLSNNYHAWNAIEINGDTYYTDTTWLDSEHVNIEKFGFPFNSIQVVKAYAAIEKKIFKYLDWYLVDPTYFKCTDEDNVHVPTNLPSYVELCQIRNNILDSLKDSSKVNFFELKKAAVSLLILLEILLHFHKIKQRKTIFNKYLNIIKNHESILNEKTYVKK